MALEAAVAAAEAGNDELARERLGVAAELAREGGYL
jgi:hypothetical protein